MFQKYPQEDQQGSCFSLFACLFLSWDHLPAIIFSFTWPSRSTKDLMCFLTNKLEILISWVISTCMGTE